MARLRMARARGAGGLDSSSRSDSTGNVARLRRVVSALCGIATREMRRAPPRATHRRASRRARHLALPGAVLAAKLPAETTERIQALVAQAGGKLPLHGRYAAGDHAAVWSELVARGGGARGDPLSAAAGAR